MVCVVTAALLTPLARAAPRPPVGLTTSGTVIWNLDALIRDTFGNRTACWDDKRYVIFAVPRGQGCPAPEARYQAWDFTFTNAQASAFRRVHLAKQPLTGVTNVPVRIGKDYVSCPTGHHQHGARVWLVFGGGHGPTGLFWC